MALCTYRRTQQLPEVEVQGSANCPSPEVLTLHSLYVVLGFPMASACGTTVKKHADCWALLSPVNFFIMETVPFFIKFINKSKDSDPRVADLSVQMPKFSRQTTVSCHIVLFDFFFI